MKHKTKQTAKQVGEAALGLIMVGLIVTVGATIILLIALWAVVVTLPLTI